MLRKLMPSLVFVYLATGCKTPSTAVDGSQGTSTRDNSAAPTPANASVTDHPGSLVGAESLVNMAHSPDYLSKLAAVKGRLSRRNQVKGRPPYTVDPRLLQAPGCGRNPTGSLLPSPETLVSSHGVLQVTLAFRTEIGADGNQRFCFVLPDGNQAPTLHVRPGDHLLLTIKNQTPAPASSNMMVMSTNASDICGNEVQDDSSTNVHFHGTNTSPACHQDQVIHTLINHGETFSYNLAIPSNEAPGLYWYHPHVHGDSENQVLGGATGALVIDGIETQVPVAAGLPERVMVIRDNLVPGMPAPSDTVPSWDIAVNDVPVPYPNYPTPTVQMLPNGRELWRVVNASADTILNLQLRYDGVPQPLQVIARDGIATNSQNGTRRGQPQTATSIFLATAARAEFIVVAPSSKVKVATLVTLPIDTGPAGDSDPLRPLVTIHAVAHPVVPPFVLPTSPARPWPQMFEGLAQHKPTATRSLYFSEVISDPNDPASPTNFYITLLGQQPKLFDMHEPPAIITTQGAVEDWTIENIAPELHEFHIHQIHFMLLEVNGKPVPPSQQQFYDTYNIPYCTNPNAVPGKGQCPSIKVRMDFRGNIAGDFVYHCHILGHEDGGMMAVMRVLPPSTR